MEADLVGLRPLAPGPSDTPKLSWTVFWKVDKKEGSLVDPVAEGDSSGEPRLEPMRVLHGIAWWLTAGWLAKGRGSVVLPGPQDGWLGLGWPCGEARVRAGRERPAASEAG